MSARNSLVEKRARKQARTLRHLGAPAAVARRKVCSSCDRLTIVGIAPGAICQRCAGRAVAFLGRMWGWRKPNRWTIGGRS